MGELNDLSLGAMLRSSREEAEERLKDVLAHLVAATSLMARAQELGRRPSQAAPSDKMYAQMMADHQASIDRARDYLNQDTSQGSTT